MTDTSNELPRWRGINHLALVTPDMDATVRFYHGVLGMRIVATLKAGLVFVYVARHHGFSGPVVRRETLAAQVKQAAPFALSGALHGVRSQADQWIADVTCPVLIMHGGRDTTIPIRFGEKLYGFAREPKQMVRFPEAAHNDLDNFGTTDVARSFLAKIADRGVSR